MAKAPTNQDLIDKIKADEAAKHAAEGAPPDPDAPSGNAELDALAAAKAGQIAASDEGANKLDPALTAIQEPAVEVQRERFRKEDIDRETRHEKAEAAFNKFKRLAQSYPRTTPDEHRVCGFGEVHMNLGDLRNLTDVH